MGGFVVGTTVLVSGGDEEASMDDCGCTVVPPGMVVGGGWVAVPPTVVVCGWIVVGEAFVDCAPVTLAKILSV